MARPELILAGLLLGLTCAVLIFWPARVHVPVILRVLGAWAAAFALWVIDAWVEGAIFERNTGTPGEQ